MQGNLSKILTMPPEVFEGLKEIQNYSSLSLLKAKNL